MAEREVTFDIRKHIGVISTNETGWRKELNIVSWNGGKPRFDIRDWDRDHERMSKGLTFIDRDMKKLVDLYREYKNRAVFEEADEEKGTPDGRKRSKARTERAKREERSACEGAQEDASNVADVGGISGDDIDIEDFAALEGDPGEADIVN